MNVLLVEDDDGVAEALDQALGSHGYRTLRVSTGAEALSRLAEVELVLLDLGLPDLDGQEVCRRIRERSCVPVIVLSGRSEELDRVMALHTGADDFIPKPFGRHELVARIQAVSRRATGCPHRSGEPLADPVSGPAPAAAPGPAPRGPAGSRTAAPLCAGPLELDWRSRRVRIDGAEVHITRKEFDLLTLFLREQGTVLERQEIMSKVWDENWFGSTRTLNVHVNSLRAKLGSSEWIETVRGVGYRLRVPAALARERSVTP